MTFQPGENGPVTIHLFRGAPAVRKWSKHKETISDWTLCGIRSKKIDDGTRGTEDAGKVTCQYCRKLMDLAPNSGGQP